MGFPISPKTLIVVTAAIAVLLAGTSSVFFVFNLKLLSPFLITLAGAEAMLAVAAIVLFIRLRRRAK